MSHSGRRDLLLLLLTVGREGKLSRGLGGITRLQKYLFLLENEEGLHPEGEGFDFTPYKAGPYSSKLYDDVEFLENLGLIKSDVVGEATDAEAEELTFEELIEDSIPGPTAPSDALEERRFALTEKGMKRVEGLLANEENAAAVEGIRRIKSRFGSHSLHDLLRYVYTKYPKMTVESEIRDQVLGRGRRR